MTCSDRADLAGLLLTLIATCLVAPGCGDESRASESHGIEYTVTATGRLDAQSEARYLAAETDGIVGEVRVSVGDRVEKGAVLLSLECDGVIAHLESARGSEASARAQSELVEKGPTESELARAEAEVATERARWQNADDRLKRVGGLASAGYAAERSVQQAVREEEARRQILAAASARLRRLREGSRDEEKARAQGLHAMAGAAVRAAEADLAKCDLRAPIDGTVLRIFRREGEFSGASQGTTLIALADLDTMIVRAEVDERDVLDVRVGMPAQVWIDGREGRYSGTVTEVASLLGRRTARTLDPADRFDRETLEAVITLTDAEVPKQVGLRMMVGFVPGSR